MGEAVAATLQFGGNIIVWTEVETLGQIELAKRSISLSLHHSAKYPCFLVILKWAASAHLCIAAVGGDAAPNAKHKRNWEKP